MIKTILFLFMLATASVVNAQYVMLDDKPVQWSNVERHISSSGMSIILNGANTELLICEGGCSRHRVTNFRKTYDGYTFKIDSSNFQYQAIFWNNTLILTDNYNRNHRWVLHRCELKPVEVTCYKHETFKLVR